MSGEPLALLDKVKAIMLAARVPNNKLTTAIREVNDFIWSVAS